MASWILPVASMIFEIFRTKSADVAKTVGVPEDVVKNVGLAVEQVMNKDERLLKQAADEIERARVHDIASATKAPPLIDFLRGLVRPLVTLTAFYWYVYARMHGIALGAEDYAIIGGIVAFWFGFRPFEKRDISLPRK
jgi:hypothetical protein